MTHKTQLKEKNLFLYIFVALYPLLPQYFAVNISNSLPLVTGSRILLVLLILKCIFSKNDQFICNEEIYIRPKFRDNIKRSLTLFLICGVLVYLPYFNQTASIKEIFATVFEKVILLTCLVKCLRNEKVIENCIKVLVGAAGVAFGFGIIESFTGSNLAYYLDFAGRESMTMANYTRLSVRRAEFTFGHPISMAMYILLLFPIIMYCSNKYNKFKYYFISLLAILCLLLTISRGPIFIFAIIFGLALMASPSRDRRPFYRVIGISVLASLIIFIIFPNSFSLSLDILKSVLNEFGADYALENFGGNSDGIASRVVQIQLLNQILPVHPLVGGGASYIFVNDVYWVTASGYLSKVRSIDNQYLSSLINYGIIGLIGSIVLMANMLFFSFKKTANKKLNKINKIFFLSFLGYYIGLFSVCELTVDKTAWIIYSIFVALQLKTSNIEQSFEYEDDFSRNNTKLIENWSAKS